MKQSNLRPRRPHTTRRVSGRAPRDHILDPYQRQQKLHESTVCLQCGAVYRDALAMGGGGRRCSRRPVRSLSPHQR